MHLLVASMIQKHFSLDRVETKTFVTLFETKCFGRVKIKYVVQVGHRQH